MTCKLPAGPSEPYNHAEDLLLWLNKNVARYGDIYKASIFGSNVYVISKLEYCEQILRRNWQNYLRKGQVVRRISLSLGNGLIASNGELWASQRRMMQPVFSKSSIAALIRNIVDVNAELLAKWRQAAERNETVNVTRDVSFMVLKITLIAIFGDDYAEVAVHFGILAEKSERNIEFIQACRSLRRVVLEIAAQRRRHNRTATDFIGLMMDARGKNSGERMTDAQLATEVMTLIVAGHETTASLLNWMWYLLSRHPESQTALSNELGSLPWGDVPTIDVLPRYTYTRQVIDEVLRLYPPLWLMTRKAVNDDKLGDFFVPAGTEIYISPYLIQRRSDLWETPDHFDPDRMSSVDRLSQHEMALCPFGAGPRSCIGELFARIETQIHLMMFAKELRVRWDDENTPNMAAGMNLLSDRDLFMLPVIY